MLIHEYIHMGRLDEALGAAETLAQQKGLSPWRLAELAWAYGHVGRTDEARKYLEELQLLAQKVYVKASAFGCIYLGLGEIDSAFDWFEKSIDERDSLIFILFPDPAFDSVRSHPRYHALLRNTNS
jgi:tetratricopeptide (TPR) repeat protein